MVCSTYPYYEKYWKQQALIAYDQTDLTAQLIIRLLWYKSTTISAHIDLVHSIQKWSDAPIYFAQKKSQFSFKFMASLPLNIVKYKMNTWDGM